MKEKGYVYLVGAGPGDPGLITVKGLELLKTCDTVIYDRLAAEELLDYTREDCEKINVGKRVGRHAVCQEEINEIIVREASKGKRIVRLKGGDSFVFGRGGEEVEALEAAGIGYELVPGVTSSISVPELAGIPVTHRKVSRSFHVITGHTADGENQLPEDFEHLAKVNGTLIFLMGVGNIEKIMDRLMEHGKSGKTKAAVISKGGTSEQRVVRGTVDTIAQIVRQEQIEAPAVIVVGEVAGYSMVCKQKKDLSGIHIGITGTKQLVKKLQDRLSEEGAFCHAMGYGAISPNLTKEFDEALGNLSSYGWIAFTSTNAVHLFMKRMRTLKIDMRTLSTIRIAVVGKGTAEALEQYGVYADFMPDQFTAVDLAKLLCHEVNEESILIPRAKDGSRELNQLLEEAGKLYDDIVIYDLVHDSKKKLRYLEQIKKLDYLIFGSSKGVSGFFEDITVADYPCLNDVTFVCIGEVTKETLKQYVTQDFIVAKTYTADGVTEAILNDVKGGK